MGKDLAKEIKKNSKKYFSLYEKCKNLVPSNIQAFLILTAIEEYSKYLMEILINKCGEATSRRNIRDKIYRSHRAKYAYYIGLYVFFVQHSNNYSRTDLHRINEWSKIRKEYLINISQNAKVDNKIVRELEPIIMLEAILRKVYRT